MGRFSISNWPASIFEKSSTSSTMASNAYADSRTVFTMSRWFGRRRLSSSTSIMPMTPFIGVRISWLIIARKDDLARLACSASSRARSSSSVRWRTRSSKPGIHVAQGLLAHDGVR
jgi:hypothetical protein